jgi:DKNYY family
MKVTFIIAGIVVVMVSVLVARLFFRLGKPVQQSRSDSYYHHAWKNKIIYSPMGNWFELGYTEMDADAKTFTVLARNFGKDKHAVYRKEKAQQVDYASFVIDEYGTPKDAFQVYYEEPYGAEMTVITGADPKTFKPYQLPTDTYPRGWAKDRESVFLYGKKIDADGKTFIRINGTLAFDSKNVYAIITDFTSGSGTTETNTRVIRAGENPGGLYVAVNEQYARNNNTLLLSNWKTEFASITFKTIDTLQVLDERNVIVNTTLVHDGHQLESVDAATAEIIDRDYLKDKIHVYFDGEKIAGADPESFEPIHEFYSKDNRHVFYKTQILEGINPKMVTLDFATLTLTDGTHTVKDGVRLN